MSRGRIINLKIVRIRDCGLTGGDIKSFSPIPVAERFQAISCGRSLARIAGSNSAGSMDVCCECCVLSGISLCVGPITRPEES